MNIATFYKIFLVWVLTIFNEGAYSTFDLSQSSIRPSIYFSSIVKSRLNPFLEPTSTKHKGNVSCCRKQRGPYMGLEPTTSTLRVRRATYCATPPLRDGIHRYMHFTASSLMFTDSLDLISLSHFSNTQNGFLIYQ